MAISNIKSVVEQNYCIGCGMCYAVCPTRAIEMNRVENGEYVPLVDSKCIKCKSCVDVCPHVSVNLMLSDKNYDDFLGTYIKTYLGKTKNSKLRKEGASGGVISTILINALDNKLIDGAIVTRYKSAKLLEPETILAKTKGEILSAASSKYFPTATNMIIREIVKMPGRYAFVGLPCQIEALRKAAKKDKRIQERIKYYLGIFCHHNVSIDATKLLLHKLNIKEDDVETINFRYGEWPGYFIVRLKNGKYNTVSIEHWKKLMNSYLFTPQGCLICADFTNELADISFGDAWHLSENKESYTSLMILRTNRGKELLKNVVDMNIKEISQDEVKKAIQNVIFFKKRNIGARLRLLRKRNITIPQINTTFRKSGILDSIGARLIIFNIKFSSIKVGQQILNYVPFTIVMLYSKFIQFLVVKLFRGKRK